MNYNTPSYALLSSFSTRSSNKKQTRKARSVVPPIPPASPTLIVLLLTALKFVRRVNPSKDWVSELFVASYSVEVAILLTPSATKSNPRITCQFISAIS